MNLSTKYTVALMMSSLNISSAVRPWAILTSVSIFNTLPVIPSLKMLYLRQPLMIENLTSGNL